ncbi:hypothetical protein IL306_012174 [Fusarium sp. DS 682]|nr:hypothetical protein IL306_012174 [Fusarium sp. DS 682]
MDTYFNTVTSEALFAHLQHIQTFADLDTRGKWGQYHLFACRVVNEPTQARVLPVYADHAVSIDTDRVNDPEIKNFLRLPESDAHNQIEHSLINKYGVFVGQFWAALIHANRQSTFDTRQDGDRYIGRGQKARLFECALQTILHNKSCQPLPDTEDKVVGFRHSRCRLAWSLPQLGKQILATDAGALCLHEKRNGNWALGGNRIAMLEVDSSSEQIVDGQPIISDENLAQMACQAIVSRAVDPLEELSSGSVIIINVTLSYVRFFQFDVTDEYLGQLEAGEAKSFLKATSTQWFNLATQDGREGVFTNICGIVNWARED